MMNTILIATDFSPAAHDAAIYGVELAQCFNARVIMLHVYTGEPMQIMESKVAIDDEELYLFVQRCLRDEADAINPVNKVLLETCSRKGKEKHDIIIDTAKKKGADLIIVGMKTGERGLPAFVYETAEAIAGRTQVPLLVVPEMCRFTGISKIVLSSEEDIEPGINLHFLDVLRDIVVHFNPRVFAVRVIKGAQERQFEAFNRPFHLMSALRLSEIEYECVEGDDVPAAMNEFIAGHDISLVTAFPRKHSRFTQWFFRSVTHSMMRETIVPLLVLPAVP